MCKETIKPYPPPRTFSFVNANVWGFERRCSIPSAHPKRRISYPRPHRCASNETFVALQYSSHGLRKSPPQPPLLTENFLKKNISMWHDGEIRYRLVQSLRFLRHLPIPKWKLNSIVPNWFCFIEGSQPHYRTRPSKKRHKPHRLRNTDELSSYHTCFIGRACKLCFTFSCFEIAKFCAYPSYVSTYAIAQNK